MKILIVNGYSKSPHGMEMFTEFQFTVQKIFSEQKELVDTETEYYIRDRDNLDDFLYELDSSYVKKEAAKLFDHLDMIFVTGDANMLPWSPTARKLLILLRMCLRVKKFLYVCSFGMQALVFLCATNFEKAMDVINGRGRGSKLGDMKNVTKPLEEIKQNEFFLDHVTGDLYNYNYDTNEWVAKANVGIHYEKAAQEYQSLGRYIIKAPVYHPKTLRPEKNIYLSRNTEAICYLKKIYLQHWAVQGLEMEFKVPFKNAWNVHAIAFVNPKKTFIVLAEGDRGPQIIELKNILATQFEINGKYPSTLVPLNNFVLHKLRLIKSFNKNAEVDIMQFYNIQENIEIMHKDANKEKYSLQRKVQFLSTGAQKMDRDKLINCFFDRIQNPLKNDFSKKNEQADFQPESEKRKFLLAEQKNLTEENDDKAPSEEKFGKRISHHSKGKGSNRPQTSFFPQVIEKPLNKKEIRQALHPSISKETLTDAAVWVPGYLTQTLESATEQKENKIQANPEKRKKSNSIIRVPSATMHFTTTLYKKTGDIQTEKKSAWSKHIFSETIPLNVFERYGTLEEETKLEEKLRAEKRKKLIEGFENKKRWDLINFPGKHSLCEKCNKKISKEKAFTTIYDSKKQFEPNNLISEDLCEKCAKKFFIGKTFNTASDFRKTCDSNNPNAGCCKHNACEQCSQRFWAGKTFSSNSELRNLYETNLAMDAKYNGNVNMHKFRDEDKEKWVANVDFKKL